MGLFSTTHQASGKRSWWSGHPVMMCGKVMHRAPGNDDGWRPGGNARVDCGGCLRAMRRAGVA